MSEQHQGVWALDSLSPAQALVGVVGAGVMGAGIAQVAAQAGHPVRLMDVRPGAAATACEQIGKALSGLVAKGRMEAAQAEAACWAAQAPARPPAPRAIAVSTI